MAARRAFSLIELILALTVLALTLSFVVGLLPSSTLSLKRAQQRAFAGELAQSLIELRRGDGALAVTDALYDTVSADVDYTRHLLVEQVSGAGGVLGDTFRIRVTVSWPQKGERVEVFRETILHTVD